jgi:hypothetical protein
MKRRLVGGAIGVLTLVGAVVFATAGPAHAIGLSQQVALIPGPGTGGANGALPTGLTFPNPPFGTQPHFVNVSPTSVGSSDTFLSDPSQNACGAGVACDTAVLVQDCDIANQLNGFNGHFRADLNGFVSNGGKLIIWDSGCGANDYSNFLFPFHTKSPGLAGAAGGGLTVTEQNLLATDTTGTISPAAVNLVPVVEGTNAALNANQFFTADPAWCVSVSAQVTGGANGGVINYAKSGEGLVVYSGLNMRDMPGLAFTNTTDGPDQLNRLFLNQLAIVNFTSLPCSVKAAASLTLTPASQTQVAGQTAPLTAHLTSDGGPRAGVTVTLKVTTGPDVNLAPATATTDSNGDAQFTYVSSIPGSDTLNATATPNVTDVQLTSTATVTWTTRVTTTAPIVTATPVFTG